ncbi:unnamed protein product [Sphagnum tenellum]
MEEALLHYVLSLEEVMKMQCVPQYMQQKQHCLNTINMTTTGFLDWLPMQRPPNSSKRQKGAFSLPQFGQSPRFLDKENLVNSQSVVPFSPFPEYPGTISGSKLVEKSGRIFGHASSFRQQQQEAPSDFFAAVGSKETGGELACQKRRTLRRRGGPEVVSQRLLLETEESSWDCIQQERERENVSDEGKDMDNPTDLVHTPAVSSSVTTARRGGIKRDRKAASGARPVTRASRRLACSSAKQDEAHGELQEESVAATVVNVPPRKAPPHLKNQTGRKKPAVLLTPVEEPEVKTRNAEPMNTGSSDADGNAQIMAAGTQMREAVLQVPQFRAEDIDEDSILNINSDAAAPKSGIIVADVQKKQPLKKKPLCGENISAAILEELPARVMCPGQKNMAILEESAAGELHNVRKGLAWEKSGAMLTGEPLARNKYGHRDSNIVQEKACPPVSQAQGGEVGEKLMVGEGNREVVQVSGAVLSSAMESCQVRKDPIFNCRGNFQLSGSTVGNSKELKCANFVRQSRAAEQFGSALDKLPSGNIDHCKIQVSPSDLHPRVNESETGVASNKPENRGMVGQIERSPIDSPAELAHMSCHAAPEASLACAIGGVEVAGFVCTGAQELKKSASSLTLEESGFQPDSGDMEVHVTRNTSLEYEEAKECRSEKTVLVKPGVSSVHAIISQTGGCELDQVPDRAICLASKDREAPMVEDEEKISSGDPECHELKDIEFEAELLLKQQQSEMQLSTDDGKLIPFTLPENCEALDASPDVGRQDVQFQQEVNPECIVTLDCCHYQKRLSPRSKARARRWRSDLGLSGKGQLRSIVFTDTPERILPVHRDCADMLECGVCSPPLQEKAKVSLTPTFMDVSYWLEPNSQQKPQQASESHLYKEAFSQEFQDGDPDTDDYKDHELLESSAADKQHESSTSSPLLMSINSLARVSQDRLSSALDFLEKPEQEDLEQSCKISVELSVEKVLPVTSASRVIPSGASISRAYKSDNPCASNPFTIELDLPTSRFVHMLSATQDLFRPVHPNVVRLPAIPTMHTACTIVSKSTFTSPIVSTPSSPHPVIFREPSPELNLPKAVDMNVAVINLPHLSSVSCSQARVDPAPYKPFSSISSTGVPSSLANLTVCLEQVTVAAVSANVSPRSPKTATLATTYSPAFSKLVDHHEAGSLQTRPEAVSNAVGHSPLSFGDTFSMVPRQLDAARFLKEASTNKSYKLVPQEMSTEMVVTCKPSDTLIQKRSTKDGEAFATHRTSSLAKGFETSEMVAEALLSVLPSSPMHEDYACAPPKGIKRVNDKDNVKHVSQASSKEDDHPGQLCNTLRQEYPSVSPPHVCVQSFSVESFKDDFKGSCRVPDRVVEEAAGRISNLTSSATKAGLADCNGAAFPCPMDSLNHSAPLPVLSCPKEGAQKLLSSEVSSSFQVQPLQKSFPSEPLADIAEKQRFFFNTPESDTSMKLARHASSKFPGMLAHKINSSESCSSLGHVPRPHAWSNLVHMDSAGGTTAVTVAPISVSDGATNPLSKHPNLSLPKHSPQSECCGSLVGAAFCGNSSSSNLLGSNLVSSMRSFLPLIQQQQIQQQQIQYATGKHDVKVKALEAAEAAKRQEEQRMEERQARKKAMEFAKKAKERTIQEKMKEEQALLKKEIQEKNKSANEILRQKGVSEERRRKEENWKRKELESAAHKQRQEMTERKEREEKRKRQEAAMKWHRPIEKRHQTELEKENKPRSMVCPCKSKLRKFYAIMMMNSCLVLGLDVLSPCGNSAAGQPLFCGLTEETFPKSYEMSPYQDSSEGEDSQDGQNRVKKEIPQWARPENLTIQLTRQLEQDPDEIFSGAMSCSLSEVFGTTGSHKRPEYGRRGSSGDWDKDRATWQEKIQYKMSMGYLH